MSDLYLVTGTFSHSEYMSEKPPTEITVTRLVMASSEEEAEEKFSVHFESKTVNYSDYYHVRSVSAEGVIR